MRPRSRVEAVSDQQEADSYNRLTMRTCDFDQRRLRQHVGNHKGCPYSFKDGAARAGTCLPSETRRRQAPSIPGV